MARAVFAGIIATAIVSALVYVNLRMEVLPQFQLLSEIGKFNARLGLPSSTQAAWATHVIVGVVLYGMVFALVQPIMPGGGTTEGVTFGLIAWLAMMVVFMPLAGHDIFAANLGYAIVAATLGVHVIFGAVLGISYAALSERE